MTDHTLPWISPARAAVAARLRGTGAITPEHIATLADIDVVAAKRYLSSLVNTWRAHVPLTRPGGNSKKYRVGRTLRDKLDAANGYLREVRLTSISAAQASSTQQEVASLTSNDGNGVAVGIEVCVGVPEFAAALGVSGDTVIRKIKAGEIPTAFKFGRTWRIPMKSLGDVMRARG
jgi:excisionase family DNA binding protein